MFAFLLGAQWTGLTLITRWVSEYVTVHQASSDTKRSPVDAPGQEEEKEGADGEDHPEDEDAFSKTIGAGAISFDVHEAEYVIAAKCHPAAELTDLTHGDTLMRPPRA